MFLILSIVVVSLIIKLVKKIHLIVDKANQAVENIENIADNVRSATNATVIGGVGAKLWKKFYQSQVKKYKGGGK